MGADGKLLLDADGQVYQVNLLEKLLVPLLAKLGNLVIDGGIWLNTQRPEWNDANNALVGQGLSMVTLYYMRRYVRFLQELLAAQPGAVDLSSGSQPVAGRDRGGAGQRLASSWAAGRLIAGSATRCWWNSGRRPAATARPSTRRSPSPAPYRKTWHWSPDARRCPGGDRPQHPQQPARRRPVPRLQPAGAQCRRRWSSIRSIRCWKARWPRSVPAPSRRTRRSSCSRPCSRAMYSDPISIRSCSILIVSCPAFLRKTAFPPSGSKRYRCSDACWTQGERRIIERDAGGTCRFNAELTNVGDLDARLNDLAPVYGEMLETAARPAAGALRTGVPSQGLHRTLRRHVRLRGAGQHLLAHGGQAAAGRAGEFLCGTGARCRRRRLPTPW